MKIKCYNTVKYISHKMIEISKNVKSWVLALHGNILKPTVPITNALPIFGGVLPPCIGALPTTQFAYWKGLGTCDALLNMSHTLHVVHVPYPPTQSVLRLGLYRLISEQPLIGSTIRVFSISSAL